MNLAPDIWREPSESAVRSAGVFMLAGGLALLTVVTLIMAWQGGEYVGFVGLGLVGLALAVVLFKYPLANLYILLAASAAVSGHTEGIQATEVVFGVYYLSFLLHWFVTRLLVYREPALQSIEDRTLFLFLVVATLLIPVSFLFDAEGTGVLSEWTALLMLGFYFPVKEAVVRHPKAKYVILGILLWIGVFAAVRNFFMYREALSSAEYAWQIVTGRVWMNDTVLMVTSLVSAVMFIHVRSARYRLFLAGTFLLQFAGLILTQSRAMWVSFAFGCMIIFLVIDREHKKRLVIISAVGLGTVALVAMVFFRQYVDLLMLAFSDRLLSLATAFTKDISLINRFYESKAVVAKIVQNPIVGYGMGVSYRFHDITYMVTTEKAFVHNGYVALWYKFGLVGFGLMMIFWVRSTFTGIKAAWRGVHGAPVALSAAVALIAMMLSANTANPFYLGDTTLTLALLTGLACGVASAPDDGLTTRLT